MPTEKSFLDELAKLLDDAAGAAQSLRAEIETYIKQRLEKLVTDMDFVRREEFEAVKAVADAAKSENERLAARIAELEKHLPPESPAG